MDPTGLLDVPADGQQPQPQPSPPQQQAPLPLPQDIVDNIQKAFGPGNYQTEDGEVTVTDSAAAVEDAMTAASQVYNEAYNIGADYNGLVNNGVTPDTTVTTTNSNQITSPTAEVKGPELTVKTPQQQLGTQQTVTQPRPLESRLAALDSNMTQMTPRVANSIAAKPLTIRDQNGFESCGGRFVQSYAQDRVKGILDSAKAQGILDAVKVRPIHIELKR